MQVLDSLVEWITKINDMVNGVVWGPPMLLLLVGVGIYFTLRTGFFSSAPVWIPIENNHTIGFS